MKTQARLALMILMSGIGAAHAQTSAPTQTQSAAPSAPATTGSSFGTQPTQTQSAATAPVAPAVPVVQPTQQQFAAPAAPVTQPATQPTQEQFAIPAPVEQPAATQQQFAAPETAAPADVFAAPAPADQVAQFTTPTDPMSPESAILAPTGPAVSAGSSISTGTEGAVPQSTFGTQPQTSPDTFGNAPVGTTNATGMNTAQPMTPGNQSLTPGSPLVTPLNNPNTSQGTSMGISAFTAPNTLGFGAPNTNQNDMDGDGIPDDVDAFIDADNTTSGTTSSPSVFPAPTH
ncbi:MAG TPA: hypothetical protein VM432_08860 [Bdellovibrionales bacterium]|nr:hypothetical protein [Bdellovibrionales bacterium]